AAAPIEPLHEHTLLSYEKEVLGFFLSGHPLAKLERQLKMASDCSIQDVLDGKAMGPVRIAGLIAKVQKRQSKKTKEPWAQFELEDLSASITVNSFPKSFSQNSHAITTDGIVVVTGKARAQSEEENPTIEVSAEEVTPLYQAIAKFGRNILISFSATGLEEDELKALKKLLDQHKGGVPVYLQLQLPGKEMVNVDTGKLVDLTQPLFEGLDRLVKNGSWTVESLR
ncbi:MAG TPA: hypothetical protein PLL10_11155, partial [Elusimicrobiales bacterium]|nr:hypothetical protein [Elusimicrobiales bacterium]